MKELIPIINEITKYGLQPDWTIPDKERLLEKDLIKIYAFFFDISYKFDETDYPEYTGITLADIRKNVETNFKDYGFYRTVLDINDLDNIEDLAIGDAIDDLTEIIADLLEVKWRIENNSIDDGLWFFELIFKSHTQAHIIDLLNYMKQKNG